MNGSIIIRDNDFLSFAGSYKKCLTNYKEWFQTYLDILDDVCSTGIKSGRVYEGLVSFKFELHKVIDIPDVLISALNSTINLYLDDLDNAQKVNGVSILYDRNYPGKKDYSSSYFEQLKRVAEDADYDSGFFNQALDFVEDTYYGVMKFFGCYDNSKEKNIRNTHEALLQYNDVTRRQIINIEMQIENAEEVCASRLRQIIDTVDALREYIYVFSQNIQKYQYDPDSFVFNAEFDSKYALLVEKWNDIISINVPTDEEIRDFIQSEASEDFLNEEVAVIDDYLADLSTIDIDDYNFWKIIIFQMFNITEGQISSNGDYSELLEKKELTDMLEELSENYSYDNSDEQEIVDECKDFLKYVKKYGDKWYEYMNTTRDENGKLLLDGRTKQAKEFNKFLDSLGNAKDILKYGDQAITILSKLFVDYEKNLEFLDSFERNANLSQSMKDCFAEIRATYEHSLNQTLTDIGRQIVDNGVDGLYSISVGKIVGIVKSSIGFVGDVTGDSGRTAAQVELLTYGYDVVNSSQSAFIESMRKLKAASEEDENYSQLMSDFKNCFTIYKTSIKRLFEKMAAASTVPQKDYYYYCSSEVASMKISDFGKKELMSYEDYLKVGYAS